MRIFIHPKKKLAALSLLETLVAAAIGSVLLVVIMALASYTARSFAAISNYVALDRGSRKALDRLTMMIREADGVTEFATNRIQLSYHGQPLIYSFDAGSKTLAESWGGE